MSISRRHFINHSALALTSFALIKERALAKALEDVGLKDLYKDDFYIGTAISGKNMKRMPRKLKQIIKRDFSAITMENDQKWERIHPRPGQWDWSIADKFVKFGQDNDMFTVGHVLVWHSQVPSWVFKDDNGKPISKAGLLARMQDHIATHVGRYKGKIASWDVVNEAIDEDKGWRQSPWFKIAGESFMDQAFHYAHEADPEAHLVYNDYNMHNPGKREFLVNYIKAAKKRGVPIQGIGLQGHVGLDFPNMSEFEASIEAYAKQGMRIHITELDVDVLPVAWGHQGAEISTNFEYSKRLNPWPNGLPQKIEDQLTARYAQLFKLFLKHRDSIERITLWGTGDIESWKNNFPVRGRTNYPLLFDRDYEPKECYHAIAALKK